MNIKKSAFSILWTLVVVFFLGIAAALTINSLQESRARTRDAKRIADVSSIRGALEAYFNDNQIYPENLTPGIELRGENGILYLSSVPEAPLPPDGRCNISSNYYNYQRSENGRSYILSFCLGSGVASIPAGLNELTATDSMY